MAAAGLTFSPMPVMAGPFDQEDWNKYIPADKKLHPDWVKSLFERGKPATYTKSRNELRFIGMPVGGICCGTLYLGGDGRLWNWDIFNQKTAGVLPRRVSWADVGMNFQTGDNAIRPQDGATYVKPAVQADSQNIAQGFAIRVTTGGKTETRPLDASGWAEVSFTGQYPIGTVEYTDPTSPVAVKLEAFSPFIPLHADDSGLPATVFHFTLTNRGAQKATVHLAGWLQNATSFYSARPSDGARVNRVKKWKGATLVAMEFQRAIAVATSQRPDIVQTDEPKAEEPLDQKPDFGTLAFGLIGKGAGVTANPDVSAATLPDGAFAKPARDDIASGPAPLGAVAQELTLAPGKSAAVHFVLAWHFPRTTLPVPDARTGNYYSKRFRDATAVATYLATELPRLESATRLWRATWYDSTLPHWFVERTFVNTSTLATSTAHRFASGRFWGWEGIGCCAGTCTHVWHYAQAMGRIFPELERDLRERVDFGVGFETATGMVRHRGEGTGPAIDGHCGRILGVWREHQMSTDGEFLKRVWPRVKAAAEYIIHHDKDGDGILDGAQENTLDAAWYGQIAWITSLTLAALRTVEEMAKELGDAAFAARCRAQSEKARASVESKLFNGEYFIQIADPKREKSLGTYEACHIDQVHGQSWAWQVNLDRVLDREKTLSALRALWKYNFAPDVGPFRRKFTAGRPYALAGDAGLVMTSNPKLIPDVYGLPSWQIGYFNECMSGFEHQAASHMVAEGMVLEGFAVTRAIHDRYHAARRNPFNEIECSDHYARAMASYGTFITACGFESHGPKGHIGFAPRLTPENFKAPFTAAGGWGTYRQQRAAGKQSHEIELKHGQLLVKTLAVDLAPNAKAKSVTAKHGAKHISAKATQAGSRVEVAFDGKVLLSQKATLGVHIELLA